jgi:hypothetical protein
MLWWVKSQQFIDSNKEQEERRDDLIKSDSQEERS